MFEGNINLKAVYIDSKILMRTLKILHYYNKLHYTAAMHLHTQNNIQTPRPPGQT